MKEKARSAVSEVLQAACYISLYRRVLEKEPVQLMLRLMEVCSSPQPEQKEAVLLYHRLFSHLAAHAEFQPRRLVGDPWQNYLLNQIICDENPFTLKAETAPVGKLSPGLKYAAARDLKYLQVLFQLDNVRLLEIMAALFPAAMPQDWPRWDQLSRGPREGNHNVDGEETRLKAAMAVSDDWSSLVDDLASYHYRHGAGIFSLYRAFRWQRVGKGGQLCGIAHPDPVRLEELVGIEHNLKILQENTEFFLEGLPANNVLLYGDRGTGKSSSIKALLHRYANRGLRLVEVARDHLADFPAIVERLRDRNLKFIIFVDDLSFQETTDQYRFLKAVLEGSVEARPANVLIYATSNRRHLVRENWPADTDRRPDDSREELLSLADRFGITLIFTTPDQATYLQIVEKLAQLRHLQVDRDILRREALIWAQKYNGFSGRTARQFVDYATAIYGRKE